MDRRMFAAAALLCAPLALGGAETDMDRATLRGITGVNVVVDRLDPELEKQGVKRETVQSEVEGRLQSAGIAVDRNAVQFVGVRVTWNRARKGPQALGIALALYQPVILARDKNVKTVAPTWETSTALLAEPKQLFRSAMGAVDQVANEFAKAFKAANP